MTYRIFRPRNRLACYRDALTAFCVQQIALPIMGHSAFFLQLACCVLNEVLSENDCQSVQQFWCVLLLWKLIPAPITSS